MPKPTQDEARSENGAGAVTRARSGFTTTGRLTPQKAEHVLPSFAGPSPKLIKPLPKDSPTEVLQ